MEGRILIKDQDTEKEEPITLVSPTNPTPVQTHFLSNLDQTVAFPVETLFFFRPFPGERTSVDILEKVKKSVSDVLLIPYYFMAGRLNLNLQEWCSSFEAIVAHIWKARAKAIFDDPSEISTVMFAVDIRTKVCPPLPHGFVGNSVILACANEKVADLDEKPFSFIVEKVKEAKQSVTDEYVTSVIDWLEIYKGEPCTSEGNFSVSAWLNLPFHELDFGYGKPIYGGPVVSDRVEFVLLLSDGNMGRRGAINVWTVLETDKMQKFMVHVLDI